MARNQGKSGQIAEVWQKFIIEWVKALKNKVCIQGAALFSSL
jgi:hypothetical protein